MKRGNKLWNIWKKSRKDIGTSVCKCPEVRMALICLRECEGVGVARVK